MTIELNQDSYVVGFWFSSDPVTGNDWLGCVIRDPVNPDCFKGSSRFRYTKSDEVWDNKDEKSWASFTSQPDTPEDKIIELMTEIQNKISEGYPDMDSVIVQGGFDKFMELAKEKPWMNIKQVPA